MQGNICGLRVRELRKKQRMAQIDLSAALSVDHGLVITQSDISEIERRIRGVKDYELKALAEVLQVNIEDLLE